MHTHKILLDNQQHKTKPTNAGYISSRIAELPARVTIEQLANEVSKGKTWCAAFANERSANGFISSSLVYIDIDDGLTITEAVNKCRELSLPPALIYTSFSHSAEKPKFRIVWQLSDVVIDRRLYKHMLTYLIKSFGGDAACKDAVRLIYGSTPASIKLCQPDDIINTEELQKVALDAIKVAYTPRVAKSPAATKSEIKELTPSEASHLKYFINEARYHLANPHKSRYLCLRSFVYWLRQEDYLSRELALNIAYYLVETSEELTFKYLISYEPNRFYRLVEKLYDSYD